MLNNSKKTIIRKSFLLTVVFMCVGVIHVYADSPKRTVKEGNIFYEQGDYVSSEQKYKEALSKEPESDIVNFNLGTALYKKEQYSEALDHFQKAFLSEDDDLKMKAYYNSGNALYKMGISEEQEGSATLAIPPIEKSLKQYERAMEINENDEDVKHNYNYVQKELKRLQQKMQQEQQQDDQKQDSEQSQDESQQQQGENQQSQSSKGQEGQQDQQQGQQEQEEQQQGQQGQEEEQQESQQGTAQEGEEAGDNNQQKSGAQPISASELTPQEAIMMLEGYQQGEEPQKPLNMQPKGNYSSPVLKDW